MTTLVQCCPETDWVVYKGGYASRKVKLEMDGEPWPIPAGSTVHAQIKDRLKTGTTANGAPIDVTSDSDFATGVVTVILTTAYTPTLTASNSAFELQIIVKQTTSEDIVFVAKERVFVFETA